MFYQPKFLISIVFARFQGTVLFLTAIFILGQEKELFLMLFPLPLPIFLLSIHVFLTLVEIPVETINYIKIDTKQTKRTVKSITIKMQAISGKVQAAGMVTNDTSFRLLAELK